MAAASPAFTAAARLVTPETVVRVRVSIDCETRSAVELLDVGAYLYSLHPSTEVPCLRWAINTEEPELWHPAFPNAGLAAKAAPERLFSAIQVGSTVSAFNAFFERCIWENIMVARLGWPAIRSEQWRCSAAKAASFALPRKLEKVALALNLPVQKDMEGNRLCLRMAKPRAPRKAEIEAGLPADYLWHEKPEQLARLFEYCGQDVRAEQAVTEALPDLPPSELALWQLTQTINLRGVYCDKPLVEKAITLANECRSTANHEISQLTDGAVSGTTRRSQLLAFAESQGFGLPNTQAATLDAWLARDDLSKTLRRVLELWRSTHRTSTRKYEAMRKRIAPDGRIRETLRYHGASTGRFAGMGIQVQNLPRGSIKDMDEACQDVLAHDRETLELLYGDVMELLSGVTRGALCAAPGHELLVADYSSIEARGVMWLAEETESLASCGRRPRTHETSRAVVLHRRRRQYLAGLRVSHGAPARPSSV